MPKPRDRPKRAASAIATHAQDPMLTANAGFTPASTKRSSLPVNKKTMPNISTAASAVVDFNNKENFVPTIADRIKQSRRTATKMYSSASPLKATVNSIPKPDSTEGAMIAASPAPSPKRNLPDDDIEPPPSKRPRCHSEAHVPSIPSSPQRQTANLAALVHAKLFEMNQPNPLYMREAVRSRQLPSYTPRVTQPRNSLPPLQSVISSIDAPHAGVSSDRTMSWIGSPEKLPPSFPTTMSLISGSPKGRSMHEQNPCDTIQEPLRFHMYCPPPSSPSTVRPPQYPANSRPGEVASSPRPSLTQLTETAPQSYPAPKIKPFKVPTQPGAQSASSKSIEDVVAPSRYPEPTKQPFRILTNTTTNLTGPICEGGALRASPAAKQLASSGSVQPVLAYPTISAYSEAHLQPAKIQEKTSVHEEATIQSFRTLNTDSQSPVAPQQDPFPISGASGPNHISDSGLTSPGQMPHIRKRSNAFAEQNQSATIDSNQPLATLDDVTFITQVKAALNRQKEWKTQNFGKRQAGRIYQVLANARPPGSSEALFLSAEEAAQYFQPNAFFPGIVVTKGQQPRPLQTTTEFLGEFYDNSATVFIQDPAVEASDKKPAVPRKITIEQLKERFLRSNTSKQNRPWNCLELATHVEDGLRPAFLGGEDCCLLTKLKHPTQEDGEVKASRRGYDPGWKEVEKWALLAQAGALTEPHQDSHGYSTYITVNQGVIGFGFLANPTAEERIQWRTSPHTFSSDKWRYVVLQQGHTVFFPSGTVHFVFRLASLGDTLAFGGHVLRCSQIVNWVKTLLEEQTDPQVTNEDLTVSAPAYLERVEKFVQQALKDGRVEIWGGRDGIEEFLALKAEFVKRAEILQKQAEPTRKKVVSSAASSKKKKG